jgi:predicted metal-dependent hydrolase
MTAERSIVTWGTTQIPYQVRRSARRATVSLTIDPRDGLLVTAPQTTPLSKLDAVVKAKARWIVSRLKLHDELPPPLLAREFISGESFLYLGRQCRLRLLSGEPARPVALHGGWLELPIPKGLSPKEQGAYARTALVAWYKRLAAERLPTWARLFADKLGAPLTEVLIADQTKRWGSCASCVLRFNWRIIQAPRSLIDYVLAHEAVHLVHEHHGREFWATLGRILPDYEERKTRLKQLGPTLLW